MRLFQVPQFIEKEARVIGPLTFSQTVIVVIVALSCVVIYYLFDIIIAGILIFIIAFVTSLLLFTTIEGIPSYKLIVPLIRHLWLPKKYSWKKEKTVNVKKVTSHIKQEREESVKQVKQSDISSLAKKLKNEQK